MKKIIAELKLIAVSKIDNSRKVVNAQVCMPTFIDDGQAVECEQQILGLYPNLEPSYGFCSFDALGMACMTVSTLLEEKRKDYDFYIADTGEPYFDQYLPKLEI